MTKTHVAPCAAASSRQDPMDVHIGSRLKARRIVSNLTQERLSEQIGVSFQQLHKYESGSNRISSSMLYRMARVLEVPIDYFFTETVEKSSRTEQRIDPTVMETARQLEQIENQAARESLRLLIRKLAGLHEERD